MPVLKFERANGRVMLVFFGDLSCSVYDIESSRGEFRIRNFSLHGISCTACSINDVIADEVERKGSGNRKLYWHTVRLRNGKSLKSSCGTKDVAATVSACLRALITKSSVLQDKIKTVVETG